mmetsp:Transcript_31088/g.68028  ORF Transcript_31088/g.68028 Transcript_31088/m.68028 type:complete len:257 (-) Transcript_31088:2100-2870(-)
MEPRNGDVPPPNSVRCPGNGDMCKRCGPPGRNTAADCDLRTPPLVSKGPSAAVAAVRTCTSAKLGWRTIAVPAGNRAALTARCSDGERGALATVAAEARVGVCARGGGAAAARWPPNWPEAASRKISSSSSSSLSPGNCACDAEATSPGRRIAPVGPATGCCTITCGQLANGTGGVCGTAGPKAGAAMCTATGAVMGRPPGTETCNREAPPGCDQGEPGGAGASTMDPTACLSGAAAGEAPSELQEEALEGEGGDG